MANPIQGYFDSTSFTLDGNGFPIWNMAVGSEFMAKFAHTVLGNGAAAVTTSGFQVVKKTGMTVTVKPYFICKDGYMMYQTAETDITFTSSVSEQVFYIGARLDVANNHFAGDDVDAYTTFVSGTDLASCKITITANAVTITDGMIEDLRYDTAYCGQIDEYRERSLELIAELEVALETALSGGIPAHASTHETGGSDPVTPIIHKARHAIGGADALTPADIGAPTWTAAIWTPTVTSEGGTITTKTVNRAVYHRFGNVVMIFLDLTISNIGSATGQINVTLPMNANYICTMSGREVAVSGKALSAFTMTTYIGILNYDNTSPIITNGNYVICGSYTAA